MENKTSSAKKNANLLIKEIDCQILARQKEQSEDWKSAIEIAANEIQKNIKNFISSTKVDENRLREFRDILSSVVFLLSDEPSDSNLRKICQLKISASKTIYKKD